MYHGSYDTSKVTMRLELQSLLLFKIMLLMENAGDTEAKVVSLPTQRYVLEGHQGLVWCQNRSANENTFHSYVDDARWYRWLPDSTDLLINTTGPGVYSSGHTLIFYPTVRDIDQGYYYCCSPEYGPCSNLTDVRISVPPVITAVKSRYIKAVGSAMVVLQCNILNQGIPQANFRWKKDGRRVNNEYIFKNDTYTTVTLFNLTEKDSGLYTCIGIGAYSDNTDSIELIVERPPYIRAIGTNQTISSGSTVTLVCMIVNPGEPHASFGWRKDGESIDSIHPITINDSFIAITLHHVTIHDSGTYTCMANGIESYHSDSIKLQVTSIIKETVTNAAESLSINISAIGLEIICHTDRNMDFIFENISNYIQMHYGRSLIITTLIDCDNNFKAVYKVEIFNVSIMSLNKTLSSFSNDVRSYIESLKLGNITLKVCDTECTELQPSVSSDMEDTINTNIHVSIIILLVLIIVISVPLLMLVIYMCHRKCKQDRKNQKQLRLSNKTVKYNCPK